MCVALCFIGLGIHMLMEQWCQSSTSNGRQQQEAVLHLPLVSILFSAAWRRIAVAAGFCLMHQTGGSSCQDAVSQQLDLSTSMYVITVKC